MGHSQALLLFDFNSQLTIPFSNIMPFIGKDEAFNSWPPIDLYFFKDLFSTLPEIPTSVSKDAFPLVLLCVEVSWWAGQGKGYWDGEEEGQGPGPAAGTRMLVAWDLRQAVLVRAGGAPLPLGGGCQPLVPASLSGPL